MRLLKKQSTATIALICLPEACLARQQLQRDPTAARTVPMHYYSGYLCLPGFTREHRKLRSFSASISAGIRRFFENKVVQCLTYSSADYNGCYSLDDSVQSHDTEHHLEQSIRCCCSELCHTCIFCKQIESSEEEDCVRNGSDKGGDRHA